MAAFKLRLALGHKHILKYDSWNRAEQGHLGLLLKKDLILTYILDKFLRQKAHIVRV